MTQNMYFTAPLLSVADAWSCIAELPLAGGLKVTLGGVTSFHDKVTVLLASKVTSQVVPVFVHPLHPAWWPGGPLAALSV
jgi:hypothetical protein